MRLLDRIAINRLVSMITSFILALTKIIVDSKKNEDNPLDTPEKPIRPRLIKNLINHIWKNKNE